MKSVTLLLSEEVIQRAHNVALRVGCEVEDVLAEWVDKQAENIPVEALTDAEILALCQYELSPYYALELRDLLYSHRERRLSRSEAVRMDELLVYYRKGIVRKSHAIQVAMARGLWVNQQFD